MRSHWLAAVIGLVSCIFLLLALEGACRQLNRSRLASTFAFTSYPPPAGRLPELLPRRFGRSTSYKDLPLSTVPPFRSGYPNPSLLDYSQKYQRGLFLAPGLFRPNANTRSVVKMRGTGEVIYDIVYGIDSFGRRLVPGQENGRRNRHLLFIGCSYTLGEGVNDNETLPAVVASRAPRFRVYNMGIPGSSPAEIIERIQKGHLWNGVTESKGTAVYVYFDDHMNRVFGSMSIRAAWNGILPYAVEDPPGHFTVNGTFKSERPFSTAVYQFLWGLETTRFFHLNLPLRLNEEQFATFARMVQQIKKEYLAKFPGQKFYVAFYPGNGSRLAPYLIPELEKLEIEYFDYSGFALPNYTAKPLKIPYDGHPSAEAHRLWGEVLATDLGVRN